MTQKIINKSLLDQERCEIDQIISSLLRELAEHKATRQRILDLLNMLRVRVMAHLQDEELSTFFAQNTQGKAELSDEYAQLCKDYSCLAEHIDRLITLATHGTIQPEWWNELEAQFHVFCVDVGRHESRVQELLRIAENNDLARSRHDNLSRTSPRC